MTQNVKQWSLVQRALISTIQDFKKGFFVWILASFLALIPVLLIDFYDFFGFQKDNYFLVVLVIFPPIKYCFLGLALAYHQTNQFSLRAYLGILRRLPSLIVVTIIEGVSLRIVPFNQLFMGFFSVAFVSGNSIWQGFKQSWSLSKYFPFFPVTFFCIESIRLINNFVLPRYLFAQEFSSYYSLFSVYIAHLTLVLFIEIFFLLFKANAYRTLIQKSIDFPKAS